MNADKVSGFDLALDTLMTSYMAENIKKSYKHQPWKYNNERKYYS